MKNFVGYIANKIVQSIPKSEKVSPTIKSVKPNLKKTVKESKSDEFSKRINLLKKAESKLKTGKEMMKEAQKARKNLVDTGRAFQFKHSKSYHAMNPGDKEKYAANMKVEGPQKKFKKGKELAKGGFPDLSGDGKTTFKDILIGRGVIKKKNGKNKKKVI